MDLKGKVVLVTGGARRVGRSIALELADAGCDIVVHYGHSEAEANEVAAAVRAKGRRCSTIAADLAADDAPARIIAHAIREHGRLDALVNNAAGFPATTIDAITRAAFADILQVNLVAPVLLAAAAWPHFKKQGSGKIVNIADISAERPWANYIAYCAAKAGLVNATKSLAAAMAPIVQVNAVAPGAAMFPEDKSSAERAAYIAKVPLKREGSPDDIAKAVRFLLADADYVTGQVLAVDGGRSIAW
jgi:pteridine reductase